MDLGKKFLFHGDLFVKLFLIFYFKVFSLSLKSISLNLVKFCFGHVRKTEVSFNF